SAKTWFCFCWFCFVSSAKCQPRRQAPVGRSHSRLFVTRSLAVRWRSQTYSHRCGFDIARDHDADARRRHRLHFPAASPTSTALTPARRLGLSLGTSRASNCDGRSETKEKRHSEVCGALSALLLLRRSSAGGHKGAHATQGAIR